MNTEDLIHALVSDSHGPVPPIARTLYKTLATGGALSITLFTLLLHPRPDLAQAMHSSAFLFKLTVMLILATSAAALIAETARPVPQSRQGWLLLLAPVLLVGGVGVELATVPAEFWAPHLVGSNASHCLAAVPLLSLPTAVCLLVALKRGAPSHPMRAGATAGALSGGIGAALYAFACPHDSPLYIATWYSIAIAVVTITSAWVGRKMLRW